MDCPEPLFMKNPEWYEVPAGGLGFFDDGRGYHIRDDAPQEAKDSYAEFYGMLEADLPPLDEQ